MATAAATHTNALKRKGSPGDREPAAGPPASCGEARLAAAVAALIATASAAPTEATAPTSKKAPAGSRGYTGSYYGSEGSWEQDSVAAAESKARAVAAAQERLASLREPMAELAAAAEGGRSEIATVVGPELRGLLCELLRTFQQAEVACENLALSVSTLQVIRACAEGGPAVLAGEGGSIRHALAPLAAQEETMKALLDRPYIDAGGAAGVAWSDEMRQFGEAVSAAWEAVKANSTEDELVGTAEEEEVPDGMGGVKLRQPKASTTSLLPLHLDPERAKSKTIKVYKAAMDAVKERAVPPSPPPAAALSGAELRDHREAAYREAMRPHQFAMTSGLSDRHYFRAAAGLTGGAGAGGAGGGAGGQGTGARPGGHDAMGIRARRIAQEIGVLSGPTALPLGREASILLRVDENRMDLMRAVIFPARETPYSQGAFVFDIYLPEDYPNEPPKVHFLTTGGGAAHHNPNLYPSGKWMGPGWDPSESTLLQVLVSIMSIILVADPWLNEPGRKTASWESRKYIVQRRAGTVQYALLPAIKATEECSDANPLHPFIDGIKTHYDLVNADLMRQLEDWSQDAEWHAEVEIPAGAVCERPAARLGNFQEDAELAAALAASSAGGGGTTMQGLGSELLGEVEEDIYDSDAYEEEEESDMEGEQEVQ